MISLGLSLSIKSKKKSGTAISSEYGILGLSSLSTDTTNNTSGYEFETNKAITVVGLRAYSPNAANKTVKLWSTVGLTLLAQVVVSTAAGSWAEASLATPVELAANTKYIVTVETGGSRYQTTSQSFTYNTSITYVRGKYGNAGTPPTGSWDDRQYGLADIVFQ